MKKRVLVTGSSRGIGKSIALRLARSGFSVSLHGRTRTPQLLQAWEELAAIDPQRPPLLEFDVTDREHCKEELLRTVSEAGAFYGVVLSVGIHQDAAFPAMEDVQWDRVIDVDLNGFYNVLRPLVLPMIQLRCGGRIVPIASLSGIIGNRGQVNYSAAKGGVIAASKALARELAKRKITVNCIAPGAIATEMVDEALAARLLEHIPMNRLGAPEEVAAAADYLCSVDAEYMTGQCLVLSGGLF